MPFKQSLLGLTVRIFATLFATHSIPGRWLLKETSRDIAAVSLGYQSTRGQVGWVDFDFEPLLVSSQQSSQGHQPLVMAAECMLLITDHLQYYCTNIPPYSVPINNCLRHTIYQG